MNAASAATYQARAAVNGPEVVANGLTVVACVSRVVSCAPAVVACASEVVARTSEVVACAREVPPYASRGKPCERSEAVIGSADGVMAREADGVQSWGDAITLEVAAMYLEVDAIASDVVA